MSRYSPLEEVAAANVMEAGNVDEARDVTEVVPTTDGDLVLVASGDGGHVSRRGGTDESADERASDDENSQTYNFGASTITMGRIKEMMEKSYFADGDAHTLVAETMSEPENDEAFVYEDFFS
jgi:hypothetical protein